MTDRYWEIPVYWSVGPFATADEARKFAGDFTHDHWIDMEDHCDCDPDGDEEEGCPLALVRASSIGEPVEILDEEDE